MEINAPFAEAQRWIATSLPSIHQTLGIACVDAETLMLSLHRLDGSCQAIINLHEFNVEFKHRILLSWSHLTDDTAVLLLCVKSRILGFDFCSKAPGSMAKVAFDMNAEHDIVGVQWSPNGTCAALILKSSTLLLRLNPPRSASLDCLSSLSCRSVAWTSSGRHLAMLSGNDLLVWTSGIRSC